MGETAQRGRKTGSPKGADVLFYGAGVPAVTRQPFLRRIGRKDVMILRKDTASRAAGRFAAENSGFYRFLYILGASVIRRSRHRRRVLSLWLGKLGRLCYRGLDRLLLRRLRAAWAECVRFGQGFSLAAKRVRTGFSHGFMGGVMQILSLPGCAIRRHAAALKSIGNVAFPLAAALALVFTVRYWVNCRYVIEVEYKGENLGYIDRAEVFTQGAALASDRVVSLNATADEAKAPAAAQSAAVQSAAANATLSAALKSSDGLTIAQPTLRLTANSDAVLADANTVCDRILQNAGESISELTGLYIDGEFEGAISSGEKLDDILEGILDSYSDGSANERTEFVQSVETVDGLYPASAEISPVDLKKRLKAEQIVDKYYEVQAGNTLGGIARKHNMTLSELRALNPSVKESIHIGEKLLVQRAQPRLQVQVVRTIVYEEEIPFKTKKTYDSSKYVTYSSERTAGKVGIQKVTAEVVYLDGIEQSRKVIDTKVTRQPTDRVLVLGSKEINPNASVGEATGRFIWPLPGHYHIGSDFNVKESVRNYRVHRGIDISGGYVYGASIVAADGGRVTEAGYHWSYGNYVRIDHGGGLVTLYAHCSKLLVRRGESVKQGQVIAKVGNTGYSFGEHLHFQVIQNGTSVSPWKYLSR